MDMKAMAAAEKEYIIGQRRWFHAHPELGREEVETTRHIVAELESLGIPVRTFSDCTGAVGVIRGTAPSGDGEGPVVMLRADIDALPIREEDRNQPYISRNPGVMHACGHDCHTAMLLGAARILNGLRDRFSGTVKLLFQMGEEIGTESRHYVEHGELDDVDAIFGMHIWALLDRGKANFEDGPRMACSDRFTIRVKGRSSHGSAPQEGRDAIAAAAAVVMGLQQLVSRRNDPRNTFVLTVGMMNGGTQSNIIAREVELVGTTRTFNKEFRNGLPELIGSTASAIAEGFGCTAESDYFFGPAPLSNDYPELNRYAREAVTEIMGPDALEPMERQMGAEDFSVYLEHVPGLFGFLGGRNEGKGICCVHHHPSFDVDEDAFPDGAAIYAAFALKVLASGFRRRR